MPHIVVTAFVLSLHFHIFGALRSEQFFLFSPSFASFTRRRPFRESNPIEPPRRPCGPFTSLREERGRTDYSIIKKRNQARDGRKAHSHHTSQIYPGKGQQSTERCDNQQSHEVKAFTTSLLLKGMLLAVPTPSRKSHSFLKIGFRVQRT